MNPALNGSSALEHFEHSSAIEIRNGILFNFYPGLPHVYYRYAQSTDAICTTCIVHKARYVVCLLTTHMYLELFAEVQLHRSREIWN